MLTMDEANRRDMQDKARVDGLSRAIGELLTSESVSNVSQEDRDALAGIKGRLDRRSAFLVARWD